MRGEIKLGPFTLHLYGLIIAAAIFVGLYLAKRRAKIYHIAENNFEDPVLLIPLGLGLLGARLYHVLDYWHLYRENLVSILYITNGGLGIWGGLFGAVLGFYVVAKIKKIDFAKILDLAGPSLLLGQAIGRVGNWINQEGFGPPTNLPWSVYISPQNRPEQYASFSRFHPTFFYEAALDAIALAVLLYIEKKFPNRIISGQVFALYLIFYSISRFIVEFWRIDTATIGPVKVAHILSLTTLTVGIYIFLRTRSDKSEKIRRNRNKSDYR